MLTLNLLALSLLSFTLIRCSLLCYVPGIPVHQWYLRTMTRWCSYTPRLTRLDQLFTSILYPYWTLILSSYLALQFATGALPFHYFIFSLFSTLLLLLACIDWYYLLLPNPIVGALILTGVGLSPWLLGLNVISILITALSCYVLLWLINRLYFAFKKKVGLGQGDMKFIVALATWFDVQQLAILIISASLTAIPFYCYHYLYSHSKIVIIPYGTFLSLSGIGCFYIYHMPSLFD